MLNLQYNELPCIYTLCEQLMSPDVCVMRCRGRVCPVLSRNMEMERGPVGKTRMLLGIPFGKSCPVVRKGRKKGYFKTWVHPH